MEDAFWIYVVTGCLAHTIDSAVGMGFGTLSSAFLMATGFPPHLISATVHSAKMAGGGAAALSHYKMKNIDFMLFRKLVMPAILGAAAGAILVSVTSPEKIKITMSIYFLVIGVTIVVKTLLPLAIRHLNIPVQGIGLCGGFLDAFAGAGWGEFTSSALLLRGQEVKKMVGTLNFTEFLLACTVSMIFLAGNYQITDIIQPALGLGLGSIIGAPIGAWLCTRVPARPLSLIIAVTIITLSIEKLFF
jgi:hypothetical protein